MKADDRLRFAQHKRRKEALPWGKGEYDLIKTRQHAIQGGWNAIQIHQGQYRASLQPQEKFKQDGLPETTLPSACAYLARGSNRSNFQCPQSREVQEDNK